MKDKLVDLEEVVGSLALEYGTPYITFDDLIEIGKKAMRVYGLEEEGRRITFEDMCKCITDYVKTPFGMKCLKELSI